MMKPRRLRYTWTGEGPGPRRGSILATMRGTTYRVLRVGRVRGTPRYTVLSLVVVRVFDPQRIGRGVFPLFWDRARRKPR
jgi:hypothetical protein